MGKPTPSSLIPSPKNTTEEREKPMPKRVFQLTHQLPFISILKNDKKWDFKPRPGHSALFSGIKSLSNYTKNVHIGYVGLILKEDNTTFDGTLLENDLKMSLQEELFKQKSCIPIFVDNKTASQYYQGYCKCELWPILHYVMEDLKAKISIQKLWWESYLKVNEAFAKAIQMFYEKEDLVWVHDYHLMVVPEMIRNLIPDCKIAYFLHAPFPSSEVFRCLTNKKELLNGILGSNLVGFQTFSYSRHFVSTCIRILGLESNSKGIDAHGSIVSIGTYPIGIDVDVTRKNRNSDLTLEKIKALKEIYKGKRIIFGRDKIEVATGVLQKFLTFEQFLMRYPEWQNKVVLIQISSAESVESNTKLEEKVSEIVSRINSKYGSVEFTPVHHFSHSINKEEYYAMLSIADVALITSVRDGMNTTSHEYIICQKDTMNPLILSEFTGTAGCLGASMLVNPFDFAAVADCINDALLMGKEEKEIKNKPLYDYVSTYDAKYWARNFIEEVMLHYLSDTSSSFTPYLDYDNMKELYNVSKKRLLLFDYDGTLTEIRTVPSAAVPSKEMSEGLRELTKDPNNVVWVISGRDQKALEEWLGGIPNLGLSAEHGCFMRYPDNPPKNWINLTNESDLTWKNDVIEIFTYYTERTQGSFIEHKRASLTWHYRMADPTFGSFQAKECQNHLENAVVSKLPVEILIGKKNIEVRPVTINKGEIVKKLLSLHEDCDFVFCAGDDKTDEDMFRALQNHTVLQKEKKFSCSVGESSKKTAAFWHVHNPKDIIKSITTMGSKQQDSNL